MNKFKFNLEKNGDYIVGQQDESHNWDGYVYAYVVNSNRYAFGHFAQNKKDGWVCYNGNKDYDKDTFYFGKCKNGDLIEGTILRSHANFMLFTQINKNVEYEGCQFFVRPDGSWRYLFVDSTNKNKAVEYIDGHLEMIYVENGKTVWKKEIISEEELKGSFKLKFQHFKPVFNPKPEFNITDKNVKPKTTGPCINYQQKGKFEAAQIWYKQVKGAYGVNYRDLPSNIEIKQVKGSLADGGVVYVDKKLRYWIYLYYKDGKMDPCSFVWSEETGTIEVKRKFSGQDKYDLIEIDKDLNVTFKTGCNDEKETCEDSITHKYNQIYKVKDKKPKTKLTPKKKPKSDQDKLIDQLEELVEELKDFIK